MKEIELQKQIMDWLAYQKDIYSFRAGSGAFKTESGRYFKTGKAGCPDIVCCYKGKWYGLEVKVKNGRQSPSQRRAECDIGRAGGIYSVVRSLDDVIAVFELIEEVK